MAGQRPHLEPLFQCGMNNMTQKIVWVSTIDPSIVVENSSQARDLAAQFPSEAKYRSWCEVLLIEDSQNG